MSGLYVNTNVNSMSAQVNLQNSMGSLSDVLTKLSTGLRINSAKDDPAGLIASEILRSDITGASTAVTNTKRANSMIAVADSALGQISNLLNDIRGLVVEAANTGAMSADQIAANQLQLDSSLDAIDRIANTTEFMGKKLLDGSMAYKTAGLDRSTIENLQIDKVNFGTADSKTVTINVQQAAQKAMLTMNAGMLGSDGARVQIGGNDGVELFKFSANATAQEMAAAINEASDRTGVQAIAGQDARSGIINLTSAGADNDIIMWAKEAGFDMGNYSIKFSAGNSNDIEYTVTEPTADCAGIIEFKLKMDAVTTASGKLDESSLGVFSKQIGVTDGTDNETITFNSASGKDVKQVNWVVDNNLTDPVTAILSSDGVLTISHNNDATITLEDIENAVNKIEGLTATASDNTATGLLPATNTVQHTTDLLVNNGLTVTAKNGGEQYNDTGVVIITNESGAASTATGATATITGTTNGDITITAKNTGSQYNGYDVDIVDDNTKVGTVDLSGTTFTVYVDAGTTTQDVVIDALNGNAAFNQLFTATTADTTAVTAAETLTLAGGADKTVSFQYQDVPQSSSAVIEDSNGNFVQLKANQTGSDYNGYTFKFVDDTSVSQAGASVDENNKIITITSAATGSLTYAELKSAVDNLKDSSGQNLFTVNVYTSDPTATSNATKVSDLSAAAGLAATDTATTGSKPGEIGTDSGTLVVVLSGTQAQLTGVTAQNVIDAFNNTAVTSPELQSMFSIAGLPGSGTDGTIFSSSELVNAGDVGLRQYSSALTGGSSASVATTAADLVDFINNDATLSSKFGAEVSANSGSGLGKLTLFNEVAYSGCPYDGTGLQFLGSDGSPSIEMSNLDANGNKVANQQLSLEWVNDRVANAEAHLAAFNANASLSISAKTTGGEYDDVAVRFVRSTQANGASSVSYTEGPSNAMAYGSIGGANAYEQSNGAFIFQALGGGEQYNNVTLKAGINSAQTEDAVFSFDEASKTFTVSVKNSSVTLADAINAFNNSTNADTAALRSQFSFALDNSSTYTGSDFGATPANLTNSENDGSATFASILPSSGSVAVLGNTGTTGGHAGGVLEIVMNDADGSGANMTANAVVDLVNNSEVGKLFSAGNYGGSNGTGKIDPRKDTIGDVIDPSNCNATVNGSRMVTSGGIQEQGYFVVHLATDGAGNSTTTAADLVNFFDSLSPEQTKGISVSLINPNGTVSTICDASGGQGILQPTTTLGDCNLFNYNDITFGSSCSTVATKQPLSEIVAVNGAEAGFTLFGKKAGTDYEGVKLTYEAAQAGDSESVAFDPTNNTITVKVIQGTTTAGTVANLINTDSATRDLFEVQLRTVAGSGLVTLSDNTVTLAGGTYETEPKGGAKMLWNSDRDDNMLTLVSTTEGSSQYINVNVLEGTFDLTGTNGNAATNATGTDTVATINGQAASSNGREISINTTSLTMSATLSEDTEAGTSTSFTIVGGGALFQIGPDVNSGNQVNLGLQSFRSEDLGGISGRLYQLRDGENADLSTNTALADKIVQEAISQVTTARGRLGALQKTTFDSNIAALQDTIEQLTTARADIVDADFATESSNMTKYQILVQSGAKVLGIANQLPQYAASLIG